MRAREDGGLAALRVLLRGSHLSGPDDLPALVQAAGAALGARSAVASVVDYGQVHLVPLVPGGAQDDVPQEVPVEGTLAGKAFADVVQHVSSAASGRSLWSPLLDGTERLGVLQLELPPEVEPDDELLLVCTDLAALVAELVTTRSQCGDAVERARRRAPMSVPAEMQWRQLPPLTFVAPRVAVSGVLAPADEVAGDSFDYAFNGDVMTVVVVDATGHGLESTLLSSVAIAVLRNARSAGLGLSDAVREVDAVLHRQFGPDRFVTGIVGELDVATGWWRWATCAPGRAGRARWPGRQGAGHGRRRAAGTRAARRRRRGGRRAPRARRPAAALHRWGGGGA